MVRDIPLGSFRTCKIERDQYELSMVSRPYDKGQTYDAGRYQAHRPGYRAA